MQMKRTCFASVIGISEIEQSEIYLTIKARLFETPGANLNGVRVTAAFLDEIVAHQDSYVCVPMYADVDNLAAKNFEHLGHMYDARTGEFHSTMIGSFYKFEKETTPEGSALIGYARIMKRNKAVCEAIAQLFANNALKLSFEIVCGSYEELEDGTMIIDAEKDNYLEGMAIVSFPACENAVALQLVAEKTENDVKVVSEMNESTSVTMTDDIVITASGECSQEAESISAESSIKTASCGTNTEDNVESAETETAKCNTEEVSETAECDTDKQCAETIPEENELTEDEEKTEEVASVNQEQIASAFEKIEALTASIEELSRIVAELKEQADKASEIIAEEEAPVNMMTAEMKIESKYSLLETNSRDNGHYSLLEKA